MYSSLTKLDKLLELRSMPATVLVVDDEEALRSLLVEALLLIDLEAATCASADEALSALEAPLMA